MPQANDQFHDVRFVDEVAGDRDQSLLAMRSAMILSRPFRAAVFIGGMEGLIEEAALVRQLRPECELLPIASTGGAAADIYSKVNTRQNSSRSSRMLRRFGGASITFNRRALVWYPNGTPARLALTLHLLSH